MDDTTGFAVFDFMGIQQSGDFLGREFVDVLVAAPLAVEWEDSGLGHPGTGQAAVVDYAPGGFRHCRFLRQASEGHTLALFR